MTDWETNWLSSEENGYDAVKVLLQYALTPNEEEIEVYANYLIGNGFELIYSFVRALYLLDFENDIKSYTQHFLDEGYTSSYFIMNCLNLEDLSFMKKEHVDQLVAYITGFIDDYIDFYMIDDYIDYTDY